MLYVLPIDINASFIKWIFVFLRFITAEGN